MKTMAEVIRKTQQVEVTGEYDACAIWATPEDVEEALSAAGFGLVKEAQAGALREAADEFATRSDTLANTTQNMANDGGYGYAEVARYAAYSAEANTTAHRLRARAASIEADQ